MPLGLFITTKANLLAGKYTFSYSLLVLWWPPVLHFKGTGELSLASPWLQHLFQISYNIPKIEKKALHQVSHQVLLSDKRHLRLQVRSLASLGQLWLCRGLEWACGFVVHNPLPPIGKTQCNTQNPTLDMIGNAAWCLDEPAVRPDMSLAR